MKGVRSLVNNITTSKVVFINMENEILEGNVLDVTLDNKGIIYSLCKNGSDNISVDYIEGGNNAGSLAEQSYDLLVIFFTLGRMGLKINRKLLIKEMSSYLKDGGNIIVWDGDKRKGEVLNLDVNVILPGKITKSFNLVDINPLKNYSMESTKHLLEPYFDIIEFRCRDNIYYIKGQKKGRTKDEGCVDRS